VYVTSYQDLGRTQAEIVCGAARLRAPVSGHAGRDPLSDDASDRGGPAGRGGAKADTAITTRHCRRRVITVGGGAMVHPQGRGLVIGLEKRKLAKKTEKENVPAVY